MTENRQSDLDEDRGIDLGAALAPAIRRWKTVCAIALLTGCAVFAASYVLHERYTASCMFLVPQQRGAANSAMASLGSLSTLVGGSEGSGKGTPEQYISLMSSKTVADGIIRKFDLQRAFNAKFPSDARSRLSLQTKIVEGKRDGLITVEFTDEDPRRAAAIANQYIVELRTMTGTLAVSEAQQRRLFFEQLLEQTRDQLAKAQTALEGSGINAAAINTEPGSAASAYAQLKAQQTAAEVRLKVLRTTLAETAPEVRREQETVAALGTQLSKLEGQEQGDNKGKGDYVSRFREFKYRETLFELYARQYETARVDESREGALIQVVDTATAPDRKSFPNHGMFGIIGVLVGLLFGVITTILLERRQRRWSVASVG